MLSMITTCLLTVFFAPFRRKAHRHMGCICVCGQCHGNFDQREVKGGCKTRVYLGIRHFVIVWTGAYICSSAFGQLLPEPCLPGATNLIQNRHDPLRLAAINIYSDTRKSVITFHEGTNFFQRWCIIQTKQENGEMQSRRQQSSTS
ncbi:hypothetical protein F5050DRAFT_962807 [Lentinula boryana]|uniref:Secreted protein n=1 Tax=Lentinula boryana TaxID=40481 RepID=A0ABQ8Q0X5_9AGAR|nr:hypothetical protein F5050DRAFT_962807 [Lentinula boryana]